MLFDTLIRFSNLNLYRSFDEGEGHYARDKNTPLLCTKNAGGWLVREGDHLVFAGVSRLWLPNFSVYNRKQLEPDWSALKGIHLLNVV